MATMTGSESQYSNSRTGAIQNRATASAAPTGQIFGSSVVAPPISGPMQNIAPGSQEWINARMAAIIEQLRNQYSDAASRRGMLQSGAAEEQFAEAVRDAEQQVAAEAANYNAQVQSREDQQAHERQIAREQGRANERAAMWSGVGNAAPYALFGKWGKDDKTLAGGLWESMKGSGSKTASPVAAQIPAPGKMVQRPDIMVPGADGKLVPFEYPENASEMARAEGLENIKKSIGRAGVSSTPPATPSGGWDKLKSAWQGGGAKWGLAGTAAGMALNPKNTLGAGLAGGLATYGNAMSGRSGFGNFALPALAGSMIQTKGKVFKGDNLWKNLIAGGALAGSFLL